MRRVTVGIGAAAFAAAALVPLGAGPASAAGVVAGGSIACDWVSGRAKLKPAFVDGGSRQGRIVFMGKLGNCRDASGENGPVPFRITGGRIKGSFLTLVNSCTNGNPFISADGNAKVTWTGPRRVAPTRFRSDGSRYQLDREGAFFSLPADPFNGTGDVTGSFAGNAGAVFGTASESPARIERGCTPRSPVLPGSGGVRKLALDSSLAVLFTA
jgi:hypothetical protein